MDVKVVLDTAVLVLGEFFVAPEEASGPVDEVEVEVVEAEVSQRVPTCSLNILHRYIIFECYFEQQVRVVPATLWIDAETWRVVFIQKKEKLSL